MAFHLPSIEDTRVKVMAWLAVVSLVFLIINQGLDILKKLCDLKKSKLHNLYTVLKKTFLVYTLSINRLSSDLFKKNSESLIIFNFGIWELKKNFAIVTCHKKICIENYFLTRSGRAAFC